MREFNAEAQKKKLKAERREGRESSKLKAKKMRRNGVQFQLFSFSVFSFFAFSRATASRRAAARGNEHPTPNAQHPTQANGSARSEVGRRRPAAPQARGNEEKAENTHIPTSPHTHTHPPHKPGSAVI
jgi:hypothetical protein